MVEPDEPPARRRYDLNGLRLGIDADRTAYADLLDFVLAPFAVSPAAACDFRIAIEGRAELPAAPAGQVQWDGLLPERLGSLLLRDGEVRTLHVASCYQATSARSSRQARVIVGPNGGRWLSGTLAFWLLDEMLIGAGRHLVHAACLARPATGDALLLFAASGTGKTTTALALARNGYQLVGDDAAVLEFRDGLPWVWGLPRPVNLHRRTAAMLPWLEAVLGPWDGVVEQRVGLDALARLVDRAAPDARPCAGVVLLQPPSEGAHRAAPLAKADALVQAATDNVRLAPGGLDEDGAALFDALARLIEAVPSVSLRVGANPTSLLPSSLEYSGLAPAIPDESRSGARTSSA
jgi:hypothetical protein